MHPLIQLLCFIIFAGFVSLGSPGMMGVGAVLLLLLWLICRFVPFKNAYKILKRMRILLMSIAGIYAWFTPGKLIIPELDRWSPTWDGLYLGGERIFALMLLILAVESYFYLSTRDAMLNGLYAIARPLSWLGLDRERFMVRVLLTLELVRNGNAVKNVNGETLSVTNYFSRMSQAIQHKVELAINAKPESDEPIQFTLMDKPVWSQWLMPALLCAIFYVGSIL